MKTGFTICVLLVALLGMAGLAAAGKNGPGTDRWREGPNALTLTPPVCPETYPENPIQICLRWDWQGQYWYCTACPITPIPAVRP